MQNEINEMEILERNIIARYNELLQSLLEEGDIETLERVITDEDYRKMLMEMHVSENAQTCKLYGVL
ncbi:MAG: hypothetical protein IJ326_08080 [Lachnospiraceae bacterium]|nr:hypothetical protein [Lachnospiraceae bacterium]